MAAKKTLNEYRRLLPDQLQGEDDLQYELFTAYCFLGISATRKLVKLVPFLVESSGLPEDGLDKYVARLKSWSARFKWVERAKKFDFRRVVSHVDKLIVEQAKIENDWVDKYKQTGDIFCGILSDGVRIKEANALLLDAAISKLQGEPKIEVLVAINKVISGVANTNATLHTILQGIWEARDYVDSITTLKNELQSYIESEGL